MAIDGWRKAGSQIIDDLCLVGHFHELSPFLLSEHPIPSLYPFGLILQYFEGQHIEVGPKDCPVSVPTPVDGNGTAPINPSDLHTVSRPNSINVGVIGQQSDRGWRLTLVDILKQFLKLYVLFVGKLTHVVHYLESVLLPATRALLWLFDPCIL